MSPSDMSFTANTYYNYRDCIQKHIIPRIGGLRLLALNQGHLMKMYKEPVKQYSAIPKKGKNNYEYLYEIRIIEKVDYDESL